MKIVHISTYPPKEKKHSDSGGVSSYTKNLVTAIPYDAKDSVFVLCDKLEKKYDKYIEEKNISIIRCFDKNILFAIQIIKEILRIRPDVVHVQQELSLFGNILTSYLLQWVLLFLTRYRLVITLHGVVSLKNIDKEFVKENNSKLPVFIVKTAFIIIYTPLCWYSKKIVVHENSFKKILIEEYKIKETKVVVIPHGVEDNASIPTVEARSALKLPKNKKIVLFMGYLTGYKGLDLLIEGFFKFKETHPDSILVIGAGKHPKFKKDPFYLKEYNRIQEKAINLLGENHKWVGFIEEQDINLYYSASDLSIYPYTNQLASSGPMSIAIGYEKPFLASDVFDNFVENKEILFQRNPDSLSQTLEAFFEKQVDNIKFIKTLKTKSLWSRVGKLHYNYCYKTPR